MPLDRGEQRLLKLLDRFERRCSDDEFEMTEVLELVKLHVQKTMTGEEGAYLLYLVKKFKIDVPIYKKALRRSNLNVEEAKKYVCERETQKMAEYLRKK